MNFASDNVVGASAPVLDAIVRANGGALPAYGADALTRAVAERLGAVFEAPELAVYPVVTGTAANALALSALVPPYGLCLCHAEAHVLEDECGAPELYAHGAKLVGLPGVGGKLDPGAVADYLDALPRHVKQMPARALTLSQATEAGLVYTVDEVAALCEVAHARGLLVHMDGARFANALVAQGASSAAMTWRAGIDVLSFGATKNGCLAAEAILVFRPEVASDLEYRRKRGGHVLSKGRLVAAQLDAYLADDHWLANARHANAAAARLAEGLLALPGVRLPWAREANEVFPVLPHALDVHLRAGGAVYHPWSTKSLPPGEEPGPDEVQVRLVTSFATSAEEVDAFLALARSGAGQRAAA